MPLGLSSIRFSRQGCTPSSVTIACSFRVTSKHLGRGPACLFFLLAGQAFLPLIGIEDDESLFAWPLFSPLGAIYHYAFFQWHPPIMLMSYLGCLKTWLYEPLFGRFGTGVWTLREPMLLASPPASIGDRWRSSTC